MTLELLKSKTGWHDSRGINDTPSGLVNPRTRIYNHSTPSEFLLGHSSWEIGNDIL